MIQKFSKWKTNIGFERDHILNLTGDGIEKENY